MGLLSHAKFDPDWLEEWVQEPPELKIQSDNAVLRRYFAPYGLQYVTVKTKFGKEDYTMGTTLKVICNGFSQN